MWKNSEVRYDNASVKLFSLVSIFSDDFDDIIDSTATTTTNTEVSTTTTTTNTEKSTTTTTTELIPQITSGFSLSITIILFLTTMIHLKRKKEGE